MRNYSKNHLQPDEERLKTSEESCPRIVKNLPGIVYQLRINKDGFYSFPFISEGVQTILGYLPEEVYQNPEMFLKFVLAGTPQPIERTIQVTQQTSHNRSLELKTQTKNGVTKWIHNTANRFTLDNGDVIWNGILVDITDSTCTEEKLKHAAEEWRATFDAIPDGVYLMDTDNRIIRVNRAFASMLKMEFHEILDKPFSEIFQGRKGALQCRLHKKILETRKPALEEYFEPDSGIYVQASASPIFDESGTLTRTVNVLRDITDHKQAETKALEAETLRQSNKAKSDLLANVAHELRTPLASIKGCIESLIDTDIKWSKQQQLEFLESANQETDRLTYMIRDLLDLSRIDSSKLILDQRSYPVSEILDSVSSVLSIITIKHQLKIENLADGAPVLADKIRIGQVITNLVENAAKFSPEGSLIEIKAKLDNNNLLISIQDRGIGMSPEVEANLFNRFYQAQQLRSEKNRGSGLGLAICKGIIEAHGGKIWVESQPNKGSLFSFSLPANSQ